MSTSPSKRFGLKRSNEIRNLTEFSMEEIKEIKLTEEESANITVTKNQKSGGIKEKNDISCEKKSEVVSG